MVRLLFDGRPFDHVVAREHGLTRHVLREALRERQVRQVLHGVYIDARAPDTLENRTRCLSRRLPPGAAVCRRTAAWLYGVDARTPEERGDPLPVECVVPLGCEPVSRPGVRGYVAPLPAEDVVVVGGVPCTSTLRTAVDLLRWLRPHMGLAAVDALAAQGAVDVDQLVAEVERWRARPGVAQARGLVGLVEPGAESFGESWLRLRMIDAGFPRPVVQIEVRLADGHVRYRLDLGWPERRLAVEYDGEAFHSTQEQRQHDARRRDDLDRRFGWTVLGVGRGEVLGSSLALERAVGDLLSIAPTITRRSW